MRFTLWPINYFPEDYSLFPIWPHWHPDWAIGLASSVLMLLFLPKLLAVIDVIRRGEAPGFGGTRRLVYSAVLETLVSMLLAPVRMLKHTRFVIEALSNVSLRWAGQNRSEETGWRAALIHHAPATLLALAWTGFALWLKPLYFFWSLPITLALIVSVPVSVLLSRASLGERLQRRGLMRIPEESSPPDILARLDELEAGALRLERQFEQAVIDPQLNALHSSLARRRPLAVRARQVRLRRRCLQEGPERLSLAERALLARDAESLSWLHHAVWRSSPESHWGRLLDEHRQQRQLGRRDPILGNRNAVTATRSAVM
jgi:membrane glycosyltransferase